MDKNKEEYWAALEWAQLYTERCRVLLKIPKYKRQFLSCHSVYSDLKSLKIQVEKLIDEYNRKIKELKK